VASVIGCTVVSMENYRVGVDEGNDLDSIDFDTLVQNLEVCMCFTFLYFGIFFFTYHIGLNYVRAIGIFRWF
jgi:hypothetical protein